MSDMFAKLKFSQENLCKVKFDVGEHDVKQIITAFDDLPSDSPSKASLIHIITCLVKSKKMTLPHQSIIKELYLFSTIHFQLLGWGAEESRYAFIVILIFLALRKFSFWGDIFWILWLYWSLLQPTWVHDCGANNSIHHLKFWSSHWRWSEGT